QSNDYARLHELSSRLEDGFQNAGEKQVFDANGAFSRRTRNATVVDRANDPVLRGVIAEAKETFGQLEPRQRAERLTQYVRDLSYPKGMDGRALDAWNAQFSQQQAGKRVYLGEYIKQGKGVCSQQSLLLKVLGDELGLEVTLVRGTADATSNLNHA